MQKASQRYLEDEDLLHSDNFCILLSLEDQIPNLKETAGRTCSIRAKSCSKTRGVMPRSSVGIGSVVGLDMGPHIVCVLPLPV